MDITQKIGKIEAIALFIVIISNKIILNIANDILQYTGTSAWLNVIYISIIIFIFCITLYKLFKPFENKDILDISEFLAGKWLKVLMGSLFIIIFFGLASVSLRYMVSSLRVIYFPNTPLVFLLLLSIIPIIITTKYGIKVIAAVNLIFTPILLISMIIILLFTLKFFNLNNIFPFLGYGIDATFFSGLSNVFAYSGIGFLYFIKPILKTSTDFKKIIIFSIIISALYLFLSVFCLFMVFPFIISTDELLSVYLLTRMLELGSFLQRLDALFILLWILATLSYLSLICFYIIYVFKKLTKIRNHNIMIFSLASILFSVCLIFKNVPEIEFFQNVILRYFVISLFFGFSFIVLIIANLKFKMQKANSSNKLINNF